MSDQTTDDREALRSILNDAGAYCGECGYEDGYTGKDGCSQCAQTLSGYADAILAAGFTRAAETPASEEETQDARTIRQLHETSRVTGLSVDAVVGTLGVLNFARADAWAAGVRTALNHAVRNPDGITLRLEHLDGRQWENPYRPSATPKTGEPDNG